MWWNRAEGLRALPLGGLRQPGKKVEVVVENGPDHAHRRLRIGVDHANLRTNVSTALTSSMHQISTTLNVPQAPISLAH